MPFLNPRKGDDNNSRKYFMINIHKRMLSYLTGIEPRDLLITGVDSCRQVFTSKNIQLYRVKYLCSEFEVLSPALTILSFHRLYIAYVGSLLKGRKSDSILLSFQHNNNIKETIPRCAQK